ncbi:hypothetical protein WJX72_001998 [[Myrmecia] bisecta]|uniref:Nuclear nucleic acid-binding protein C1D n=1 Tax=[Myrmecia] bisecta TaxID=41462 RepID=A0AAW1PFU4_9CHLO
MDISLPSAVTAQLQRFTAALDYLQRELEPITSVSGRELDKQLEPLERAQLHMRLSEALLVLFHLYLRAHGQQPADQPTAKEAERLELYKRKVQKVVSEKELQESRPTVQLNVAAANRFINSAIPDLTPAQRKALREPAQRKALREAGVQQKAKQQQAPASQSAPKRKADSRSEADAFLEETLAGIQAPPAKGAHSRRQRGRPLTVCMGKTAGNGPFTPLVILLRNVMGQKEFNQLRGKGISLHSQVIKEFGNSIGADNKQVQGLIRLAKKNGDKLGFLS